MSHRTGPSKAAIAVFDANREARELIAMALAREGYHTVCGDLEDFQSGGNDLAAFVEEHNPHVVIIDVPYPYTLSWARVQTLTRSDALRDRNIRLTTTDRNTVRDMVERSFASFPVIEKPLDLERVIGAVQRTLGGERFEVTTTPPPEAERRRHRRGTANSEPQRDLLLSMILGMYREMPGLRLDFRQAARLFGLRETTCRVILDDLVNQCLLQRGPDDRYGARSD